MQESLQLNQYIRFGMVVLSKVKKFQKTSQNLKNFTVARVITSSVKNRV